jgi:hypothetical protein
VTLDQSSNPLKQVAGLIQKLSYRDMQLFASDLATFIKDAGEPTSLNMASALLKAADHLLAGHGAPVATDIIGSSTADRQVYRR